MKKIVILFSGEGTNLECLIQNLHPTECQVACAITNKPNANGILKAKNLGINVEVIDNTHFNSREEFDNALVTTIETYAPDLVVLAGFMRILTPRFTLHVKAINIHPSLLPLYKGANAIERSYVGLEKEAGISVHYVSAELDGGDIILQQSFSKVASDTLAEYRAKIQHLEHHYYSEAVKLVLNDSETNSR